ncbi:hypothetical protein [Desulfonema ishimotonii]|uniref:hypothetical protein n=1 Tax=Desulfonema ishimotonii TaxID=45657 RepID=UPI00140D664F|nr:hypothetical protein [Desulfonema ishimotonii]
MLRSSDEMTLNRGAEYLREKHGVVSCRKVICFLSLKNHIGSTAVKQPCIC